MQCGGDWRGRAHGAPHTRLLYISYSLLGAPTNTKATNYSSKSSSIATKQAKKAHSLDLAMV